MTGPLVKFEKVSFKRGEDVILKDVNWEIGEGENWALLGLNGSGKSTLLSMLPAYTYPSSGEVYVLGHRYGTYPWENIRKRMGFLSSSLNKFSSTLAGRKVEEVVVSGLFASLGLYEKVEEKDLARARKILKDFELEEISQRKFGLLSEGERRRTLIARAFMGEVDLVVLDEPCASLDLRARERLLGTLLRGENSIPLIYVTHQIDELLPEISHIAILDGGKIIHQGRKEEVLTDQILTDLYGIGVKVYREGERPFAIITKK